MALGTMGARFATLLGLVLAAQAAALTCTELAGRRFGSARILETHLQAALVSREG